jgi:uncharacterized protein YndB with AHSA1/START domain
MELAAASVSRSVDLPVSVEEAWASIGEADGLAGWLGDAVDLEVIPGAVGTVTDGDAVRRVVVSAVEAGRSVELVWWDEATPEGASVVTIALEPGVHGTTVTVTERLAGAASASVAGASIGDLAGAADAAWDRRLQALVGDGALSAACV